MPTNPLVHATPEVIPTLLTYPPPLNLKHRPRHMMPFEKLDGGRSWTDAKYLSTGLAQWPNNSSDVSAKIWRYAEENEKWSRMSEELPLDRLANLCLFTALSVFATADDGTLTVPAGTFEGQEHDLVLRELDPFPAGFDEQRDHLKERLRKLRDVLNGLDL